MDSDRHENKRPGYISHDRPTTARFGNLPPEVAIDLISRLPIASLMRFRFVSKSCQTLSFDPFLVNLHRSQTVTTCLIFHFHYPFGNQLQFVEFSHHNDKETVRQMQLPFPNPTLALNVIGSCNGLICSSNSKNHDAIHIFNPFTRSYKQLPEPMQFEHQKVVAGFGFHPLTNEYKVVRIVYYQQDNNYNPHGRPRIGSGAYSESRVQVYSVGSGGGWRSIGKMPYQVDDCWSSKPLLVDGRLHLLTRNDYSEGNTPKIVSFDLADEQFREVPTPNWGRMWKYPYPLAVLGGRLSVVINPRYRTLEIWVMKESWSKHVEIDANDMKTHGDHDDLWGTSMRVLCQTKSGGILLMHAGAISSYDPESRELKNVTFEGMPFGFQAIAHEGSLVCLD